MEYLIFIGILLALSIAMAMDMSWNNVLTNARNEMVFADRHRDYGAFVLRRDYTKRLILAVIGSVLAFGLAVVIGPLHMDKLGASPFLIAAAFASGSVIEAVIGPVIGRVSDRVGRTLPYLVGVAAMAVAVIGLGAFGVLPLMFVTVMVMAFGAGLAFTPASSLYRWSLVPQH